MNRTNVGRVVAGAPVYGACRPGHLGGDVDAWIEALASRGVGTVVCLLSESEAARFRLPDRYDHAFRTHHVPIRDRHLPAAGTLERAVDLLDAATADGTAAAIHCNAGLGRTGVVAAGWLVRERDLSPRRAVERVENARVPRSPREAIRNGNATRAQLYGLLDSV